MRKWLQEYAIQLVVMTVILIIMSVFVMKKEGYHMDEVLSFELANAEYTPWIVPYQPEGRFATFVYQEIETGDYWETMGNWIRYTLDYWINGEDSFAYNYEGNVYVQAVWIDRDDFLEFVATGDRDRFNFVSVYYNVIRDTHPPLYYMALHLSASLFPGKMLPWIGSLVNLAAMTVTCIFLLKTGELLTGGKRAGTIAMLFYCLSAGGIATVLLIRMYSMLTMFCVISLYLHLKKWKMGDYRCHNTALILITVYGFWTQYYFVFFAIFLALVSILGLLASKKVPLAGYYLRSMVLAAMIGLCGFPYAVSDVLEGNVGKGVLQSLLSGMSEFTERLRIFGGFMLDDVCGSIPGLCVTLLFVLLLLPGCVLRHGRKWRFSLDRAVTYGMLIIPAAGYFLLAARVSPFYADRYIMPVFAVAALLMALIWEKARQQLASMLPERAGSGLGWGQLILAGVLCFVSVFNYSGSYLYTGYKDQLEVAKQYADYPCLCLYDGVTFYENVPEFTIYRESLLLTRDELVNRCQFDLLVDGEDVVVLIKRGVDEEWTHQIMAEKYGYNEYVQIFQDTIYGEKIFLYHK